MEKNKLRQKKVGLLKYLKQQKMQQLRNLHLAQHKSQTIGFQSVSSKNISSFMPNYTMGGELSLKNSLHPSETVRNINKERRVSMI